MGGSTWCALDPAASAKSSLGPAAYLEYEREFGSRIIARWPQHLVLDGLDMIENLLESGDLKIHPRCVKLKDAFRTTAASGGAASGSIFRPTAIRKKT